MDQTTENYECLVINNNAKSNKLTDMIFWYKAENRPTYRLGAKEFWDLSSTLTDDDGEKEYDPNQSKKRTGPSIHVKKTKW
jgi:hypothetical protein